MKASKRLLLAASVAVLGCAPAPERPEASTSGSGSTASPSQTVVVAADPTPPEDSTPASLAELIRELETLTSIVSDDTIAVQARDRSAGQSLGSRFKHHFAPYASMHTMEFDGVYAVARFAHRPGTTGFILRVPSQNSSSALDLWLFSPSDSSFVRGAEVADGFGDGPWFFTTNGWLVDLDRDGVRDLVARTRSWWEDDDGEEHESDSLFVQIWSGSSFSPRVHSTDTALRARFDITDWLR